MQRGILLRNRIGYSLWIIYPERREKTQSFRSGMNCAIRLRFNKIFSIFFGIVSLDGACCFESGSGYLENPPCVKH